MMRTRWLAMVSVMAALAAGPAVAQEACNACLKAAAGAGNKCQEASKAPADAIACDKQFAGRHRQCALGACKGTPHAEQTPCKGCLEYARVEVEKCLQTMKSPADKARCDQQAKLMSDSCNQRFCAAEPAKPAASALPAKPAPAAAPDACIDCRKATAISAIQCHQSSRSDADKAACDKKGQDAVKACSEGACKGRTPETPPAKAATKPAEK